jgi:arginase family enzyme
VKSYVESNVHPSRPIMIGVDHSQTGGVLQYLTKHYEDPNVLIFDSHTDIVDFSTKRSLFTSPFCKTSDTSANFYECGSFVDYVLSEKVMKPDRIWILGTQDLPERTKKEEENSYVRKLEEWMKRGVHLISKWDLIRNGIPEDIEGPTYISIDMDLGSYSSVFACRFMDRVGLEYEQITEIIRSLSARIKERRILLLGLDMMEIDVHFLEAEVSGRRDCTLKIIRDIFEEWICCAVKANGEDRVTIG